MKTNYKPEWNPAVSPYLMVENVENEIAFLQHVFAGEIIEAPKQPDGKIFHAEIRIDDSIVMIGRSQEGGPALKGNVYVYVPSADETYQRALEAGATNLTEPADQFYGNRQCSFVDPSGNQWWVAQLLGERPMTEQEITDSHPAQKDHQ